MKSLELSAICRFRKIQETCLNFWEDRLKTQADYEDLNKYLTLQCEDHIAKTSIKNFEGIRTSPNSENKAPETNCIVTNTGNLSN